MRDSQVTFACQAVLSIRNDFLLPDTVDSSSAWAVGGDASEMVIRFLRSSSC